MVDLGTYIDGLLKQLVNGTGFGLYRGQAPENGKLPYIVWDLPMSRDGDNVDYINTEYYLEINCYSDSTALKDLEGLRTIILNSIRNTSFVDKHKLYRFTLYRTFAEVDTVNSKSINRRTISFLVREFGQ